jgi:hypothetical protein
MPFELWLSVDGLFLEILWIEKDKALIFGREEISRENLINSGATKD